MYPPTAHECALPPGGSCYTEDISSLPCLTVSRRNLRISNSVRRGGRQCSAGCLDRLHTLSLPAPPRHHLQILASTFLGAPVRASEAYTLFRIRANERISACPLHRGLRPQNTCSLNAPVDQSTCVQPLEYPRQSDCLLIAQR
jgi:hypothetical protein